MAWKFVCEKQGEMVELPYAYINGYNFGDRLLEGVMFKVEIVGTKFKCSVTPSSESYMKSLNKKKWVKEAEAYAESEDIFCETERGGEDVWVEDENGKEHPQMKSRPKPVAIGMTSAAGIMQEIMGGFKTTPKADIKKLKAPGTGESSDKNLLPKVPMVSFVCTECGDKLDWNNFDDGTPVCLRCDKDMVVDISKYSGY